VRRGKGGRDRYVPIGESASRYLDEVRPRYALVPDDGTLFLSAIGGRLGNTILSRTVTGYIKAAVPTKRGSCHLFRHSAASLMLDAGADVRHVAELLGHARLETTMIYTRVSVAKLQAVHAACRPAERGRG
jgi:integrase/recombinase XerD